MDNIIGGQALKKICMVMPYFGVWPDYFLFFLKSCEYNPTIDWLFYTNCGAPTSHPDNVRFIKATLEDFNALASKKIAMKIGLQYPYKLCDMRAAYGHIFEDYLQGYDFWGYGDIDLIYGNIRHFFTGEILSRYDIVTGYHTALAGPLTFFKNDKTK